MARPTKQGVDYFPVWKPQAKTVSLFSNISEKVRYKSLRNSSSAFIKRKDVREIVLKRGGYRCAICGSTDDLEIDHIYSVYSVLHGRYPLDKLNTSDNLRVLCKHCNSSKTP